MRWYCPGCWRDFGEDLATCRHCGLDIHAFWDSKDYVDKLILALHHPEPTAPVRAAELLGRKRTVRAVEPLMRLVRESQDVFAVRAAMRALAAIGTATARRFLETLIHDPADWIRAEAAADLGRAASDHNPLTGDAR